DGVDQDSITEILAALQAHRYSTSNIAFGMGGALLQRLDRDTQRFALKCSAARVDGRWIDVYKQPVTDPGKLSKRGRLVTLTHPEFGTWKTVAAPAGVEDPLAFAPE